VYQTDALTRALWLREIPRRFYGSAPFVGADGLGCSQMRAFLDQGYVEDGDPATWPEWAALTVAQQGDLANDYADYLLRMAAGDPGVIRYGV